MAADEAEERAAATVPSNGLGGGETTPLVDPNFSTTANGGETAQATGPEAAATPPTNGGFSTHCPEHRALLHATRYSGRALVARLLFVARWCRAEATELEALRMALREVWDGKDVTVYGDICHAIRGRFGPAYDQTWVDAINEDFNNGRDAIVKDISRCKENHNTAGIKNGYVKLGGFYYDHGYLPESFKSYIQMEEYFTASEDVILLAMKCILINIELQKYDRIFHYVNMAKACQDSPLGPSDIAMLHAATGLAHLGKKEYRIAAFKFLETGPELGRNFSEFIAPEDVATYGSLCALASLDCLEMKVQVMDNVNFGVFLELVPQIRNLVNDFFYSQHASCMKNLQSIKSSLMLDIHLANHVETLLFVIAQKSGYVALDEFPIDGLLQSTNFDENEVEQHESLLNERVADESAREENQSQIVIASDIVITAEFNDETPVVEEESAHEENQSQNVIVSNLVLPAGFDDMTPLAVSTHYKFVNPKELMLSLGKRSIGWVSRLNAHALLVNARLFVRDSVRDNEERFDGRMVVVSDAKFGIFEVQYGSYTTTRKPLKEIALQEKENSAVDRFQMKGDIWTRRRICLKNDHRYHLLQWRKTSGLRRAQVQPLEATAAHNVNNEQVPPEAATTQNNNTELNETLKSLIDHLKDQKSAMALLTKALTETGQSVLKLNCSLAEACKTNLTATMGSGGVTN